MYVHMYILTYITTNYACTFFVTMAHPLCTTSRLKCRDFGAFVIVIVVSFRCYSILVLCSYFYFLMLHMYMYSTCLSPDCISQCYIGITAWVLGVKVRLA